MLNKEPWSGQSVAGSRNRGQAREQMRHGVGQAWLKAMSASHRVNLSFEL